MADLLDLLESSLDKKSIVLDDICGSNRRLIEKCGSGDNTDYASYDEYLDEQETLMEKLEELDLELDNISTPLLSGNNRTENDDPVRKQRIRSKLAEIDKKIENIRNSENEVKDIVRGFITAKRSEAAESKRMTRVISNRYGAGAYTPDPDDARFSTAK